MDLNLMKKLCLLTEDQLHRVLYDYVKKHYKRVISRPEYLLAEGDIPICLIAHLDTVFKDTPLLEDFFYDAEKGILWSPCGSGFDDRAGIYSILNLLSKGYRPHVIFTHGEEKGGIGSYELIKSFKKCPFKKCKALIQIDRAYEKDCVFYDCDNSNFIQYIESFGFETTYGTFSDISIIAPQWKIAAVNLSCGYLDEHTRCERLVCSWCDATIERIEKILQSTETMQRYKYIAKKHNPWTSWYGIDTQSCLICGNRLPGSIGHWIKDDEYPYKICDECYNKYYLQEEEDEIHDYSFDF